MFCLQDIIISTAWMADGEAATAVGVCARGLGACGGRVLHLQVRRGCVLSDCQGKLVLSVHRGGGSLVALEGVFLASRVFEFIWVMVTTAAQGWVPVVMAGCGMASREYSGR